MRMVMVVTNHPEYLLSFQLSKSEPIVRNMHQQNTQHRLKTIHWLDFV